jgi:hypothetical protein
MPIRNNLPKIALVDTDEISGFRRRKLANAFLSRGGECPLLVRLQLTRQFFRVRRDQRAQALTIFIACDIQHIGPDSIRAYFLISAKNALISLGPILSGVAKSFSLTKD